VLIEAGRSFASVEFAGQARCDLKLGPYQGGEDLIAILRGHQTPEAEVIPLWSNGSGAAGQGAEIPVRFDFCKRGLPGPTGWAERDAW